MKAECVKDFGWHNVTVLAATWMTERSHVTDCVAVCACSASKVALSALLFFAGRCTDNAFKLINKYTQDGVATNKITFSKLHGKQIRRTRISHIYIYIYIYMFCTNLADTRCVLRQSHGWRSDDNQNCRNVTEDLAARTGRTLWLLCSPTGSLVILEAIWSTRHHCTTHPSLVHVVGWWSPSDFFTPRLVLSRRFRVTYHILYYTGYNPKRTISN